jgi:hypothetical protein
LTRLITLDFDGVLHPGRDDLDHAQHLQWLSILVSLLAPWSDVRLAIHSTWRYTHTPEELRALLGPLGTRLIGVAPRGPREESIVWLLHLLGDIDDYLVLDDAPKEFDDLTEPALVLCHPEQGISAPSIQARIKTWLERPRAHGEDSEEAP